MRSNSSTSELLTGSSISDIGAGHSTSLNLTINGKKQDTSTKKTIETDFSGDMPHAFESTDTSLHDVAQAIAKRVLQAWSLTPQEGVEVQGTYNVEITAPMLLEMLIAKDKVEELFRENEDLKQQNLGLKTTIGILQKQLELVRQGKAPDDTSIFMQENILGTMSYGQVWDFLKDKQGCYDFARHLSHLKKDFLEEVMKGLHSHSIPQPTINQTILFEWPEVSRESKETQELRSRLGAPLQRDSVEDSTIAKLFELAQNKTNIQRVTQYCILRYAAGMPLKP